MKINILIATLLLAACASKEPTDETLSSTTIPTVRVVHPTTHLIGGEITITGRVEPNAQVRVHAREGGYVKRVLKDIGDHVKAGDALAELDAPELYQLLRQKEAEATAKRSTMDRLVAARGTTPALTPAQLIEDAEAANAMAESELNTIRERIAFLTVRAPISGVITERLIDPGAMVQTGTTNANAMALFELQAIDPVRIVVPVPARDAVHATIGTTATISLPDLTGDAITATVTRTSGSLDALTGNLQVEFDVPNANGRIRPGMFATVILQPATADSSLALPTATAFAKGGTHYVYAVRDGKVVQLELKKGLSDKNWYQILQPTLSPSEMIIIEGRNLVRPGDTVEPIIQN